MALALPGKVNDISERAAYGPAPRQVGENQPGLIGGIRGTFLIDSRQRTIQRTLGVLRQDADVVTYDKDVADRLSNIGPLDLDDQSRPRRRSLRGRRVRLIGQWRSRFFVVIVCPSSR